MLVKRANPFRTQIEYAAPLKNTSLSILDMFPLYEHKEHDTVEIDERFCFLFPSPEDTFNINVFRAPSFPLKYIEDVLCLYDLFIVEESAHDNLDGRTKQNPTAKLLLRIRSFFWNT